MELRITLGALAALATLGAIYSPEGATEKREQPVFVCTLAEPDPVPTVTPPSYRTHTIEEGDTLSELGQEYGVDWQAIQSANDSVDPRRLQIGQELIIPHGSEQEEVNLPLMNLEGLFENDDAPYIGPDEIRDACPTNYYSDVERRPEDIRRIVIHTTDSYGESAINTFQNPSSNVSAHYVIARDGTITGMVPENYAAWHASGANSDSIGIEFVGRVTGSDTVSFTREQLESGAGLVRTIQRRYDIPTESIDAHSHHNSTLCPGEANYLALLDQIDRRS